MPPKRVSKKKKEEKNCCVRIWHRWQKMELASKLWIIIGLIHAVAVATTSILMFVWSFSGAAEEADRQRCYAVLFMITTVFFVYFNIEGVVEENILQLLSFKATAVIVLAFGIFRITASSIAPTADIWILFGISACATLSYIVLSIFLYRSFGWYIYRIIGSDPKKRNYFLNLTLFRTFLKLDLYLHMMLVCIGLFFYQEAEWEYYVITGGALFLIVWTVLGLLVMRYEKRALAIVWLLFGLVTPPYITLKMIDIIEGHPNAPIVQSLLIAIGAAALRICVFVTGIRCVVFFHRGIKDILDERSARSKQKGPKFVGRLRTADKELTATDNPIGPNGEHTGTSIV